MDKIVGDTLSKLLKENEVLVNDLIRCRNLLHDYCPDRRSDISLLFNSINSELLNRLKHEKDDRYTFIRTQLINKLIKENGLREEVATWIVATWCQALGYHFDTNIPVKPTDVPPPPIKTLPNEASSPYTTGAVKKPSVKPQNTGPSHVKPKALVKSHVKQSPSFKPFIIFLSITVVALIILVLKMGNSNKRENHSNYNTAVLKINSSPSNAKVYVDDKYKGRTPFVLDGLLIRTYKITLKNGAEYKVWNDYVSIKQGTNKFFANLIKDKSAPHRPSSTAAHPERVLKSFYDACNRNDHSAALNCWHPNMRSPAKKKMIELIEWFKIDKMNTVRFTPESTIVRLTATGKSKNESIKKWELDVVFKKFNGEWKIYGWKNVQQLY